MTDGSGQYVNVCTTIVKPSIPLAVDNYYVGVYNTPRVINSTENILLNDSPSNNTGAVLRVTSITQDVPSSQGNLTQVDLTSSGTRGTFIFTPARGFSGNATFQYGA